MIRETSFLIAAAAVLTGSMAAQPRTLHTLLVNPTTSATRIARQLGTCATPASSCSGLLQPAAGWAGGLAHAPSRDTLWYTDGTDLVEKTTACLTPCSTPAVRSLGRTSSIGGLAISATRGELFQVESVGGQAAITTYALTFPCPTPINTTPLVLPTQSHRTGGLAYDATRDYLLVAVSAFNATPLNFVYVMSRAANGIWARICVLQVDACNGGAVGPIQGMTYDECRGVLWIADDARLYAQDLSYRTGCPTLTSVSCCSNRIGEDYHGIEVEVGSVTEIGASCSPIDCGGCSAMRLAARGRPIVGNTMFQLQITKGPVGRAAFLVLSGGPCTPVPFGCGTFYPSVAAGPIVVPLGTLSGPGPCAGSALLNIAVPGDYALCGLTLCAQGIVACPQSVALTNGVSVTIEG